MSLNYLFISEYPNIIKRVVKQINSQIPTTTTSKCYSIFQKKNTNQHIQIYFVSSLRLRVNLNKYSI